VAATGSQWLYSYLGNELDVDVTPGELPDLGNELCVDATAGEEQTAGRVEKTEWPYFGNELDVDATAGEEPVIWLAKLRKLSGLWLPEAPSGYTPTLVMSCM
jgi:hypothetical protein